MDDAAWQGVRAGLILLLVVLSAMFSGLTLGLMGLDKNNLQCVPAPRPPARRRRPMAGPKPMAGWAGRDPGPPLPGLRRLTAARPPHLAHQPAGC